MNANHSQDAIRVCGMGLITPLGNDLQTSWQRIVEGASIIDHARTSLPFTGDEDRVTSLGVIAARQAIAQAGWSRTQLHDPRCALVVGTSKGPVDKWIAQWQQQLSTDAASAPPSTSDKPPKEVERACPSGLHTVATGIRQQISMGNGPMLTVSCACATGIAALIRAVLLLRDRSADRVLIIAAESSLHPLFIGSFRRLGVLTNPGEPVRPMDQHRSGFLISEAAAAICLERAQSQPGDILINRFAMGADATHLTGIDPQGQTIRSCLNRITASQSVDLIHAHATGTDLNDPIELAAIDHIASTTASQPIVYSHKAALGHSLGAAGLVSVVLNCMMHRHGVVPGNINTQAPLATTHARISRAAVQQPIQHSIAMAAGFGGAAAAISLISA